MDFRSASARSALSRKVGERDLGLDHPELGEVAAGVRVLGAERRAEGVDLREREAVGLDVELAGDGEEGLAAEEVLGEVDLAAVARQVREIERRDPEQRARALGVGRGDDRRVDPEEAALVEEAVDRLGERVAHARHGGDHVGARPEVRHFAQELEACAAWAESGTSPGRRPSRRPGSRLACISKGWPLAGEGTMRAGRLDRAARGEVQHLASRSSAGPSARRPAPGGTRSRPTGG